MSKINICNSCGKRVPKKDSRCSRCKKVFYCSIDCQRKDWPIHKFYCKIPSEGIKVIELDKEKKKEKTDAEKKLEKVYKDVNNMKIKTNAYGLYDNVGNS